jgi:hypothetical protein
MLPLPPDFKEFLRLLDERKVEYLLIGGYAVAYHGYPRGTADMDVWVAVHPRNAERVVEALRSFGMPAGEETRKSLLEEGTILLMGVPPLRLEVLTSISGVSFEACYAGRVKDVVDGVPISVISAEHLKRNKQASGRLKDLEDLRQLP